MNTLSPVITLDGPSGAGKSTIGHMLAQALGWHFLDSGSLYRLLALSASWHQVDTTDEDALCELAANLDVEFKYDHDNAAGEILLGERIVTQDIRSEGCSVVASQVAALQAVRTALLQRQRDFRVAPGLVADGRDMGTVVFPDAPLKFFISASIEERARRRYLQLTTQGVEIDPEELLHEMIERDTRDRSRKASPLVAAEDAISIDTAEYSARAVLDIILKRWQSLQEM